MSNKRCAGCGHAMYGFSLSDGKCWRCTAQRWCGDCGKDFPKDDFVHDCTFSRACGAPIKSRAPDPTNTVNMAERFARCPSPPATVNGLCRRHDKDGDLLVKRTEASRLSVDWRRVAAPVTVAEVMELTLGQAWTLVAVGAACARIERSTSEDTGPIAPPLDEWVLGERKAGRTLDDIANELGVTPERVRQRQVRAERNARISEGT